MPRFSKCVRVVTFCTGGIRCEKAAIHMHNVGFDSVYQLDGGILKYFEEVGGEPLARRICNDPVVLFRDGAGKVGALAVEMLVGLKRLEALLRTSQAKDDSRAHVRG